MFHCLPDSAWADGNMAEAAGQLGKMGEHSNESKPNPVARADGSPCTCNKNSLNYIFLATGMPSDDKTGHNYALKRKFRLYFLMVH